MKLLTRALTLLILVWCSSLTAQESGAVAVGSFSVQENIDATRLELMALRDQLGIPFDILVAPSGKPGIQRVLAAAATTDNRALLTLLRENGYSNAWYLADIPAAPQAPVEPEPMAASAAPEHAAAAVLASKAAPAPVTPPPSNADTPPLNVVAVQALAATQKSGTSPLTLLGYQDDIPFHRLRIQNLKHKDVRIKVDGVVDEPVWQTLDHFDNMIVAVPGKGTKGEYPTEIRLLATEKGLYVSSVMHQPVESLVKRFSVRDDFIDRDTFGITLDMSGEGLVGYWFIVALGGSMMDGKVLPERNYQRDWDGPWFGKSTARDDGWSVEMFLPWSMMNMPDTGPVRNIGFAASRQISSTNERYQWPGYPYSSAKFVSALNQIDVEGVEPQQQLSVIPFASSTYDMEREDTDVRVGADISWKPSPKLELTGSINPDFGAVEADNLVLNLTASETFFPEKRLFFLEGNEVFSTTPRDSTGNIYRVITNDDFNTASRKVFANQFVPTPISLMNTRRIGGTASQVTLPAGITADRGENNRPTDLLAAAKVTGALGNLRYGVLTAFEDDVNWYGSNDTTGLPALIEDEGRDFNVVRLLYEQNRRDRRSIGYMGTRVSGPVYDANVHGLDAHYTNISGKLIADLQLIRSDVDSITGNGGMIDVMYAVHGGLRHKFELDYMDEQVDFSDFGFLRRNDYANARYVLIYNKQNLTQSVTNFRSTLVLEHQRNISEKQSVGGGVFWRTTMQLPSRNTLRTAIGFLPARHEDIDSRGNGTYNVDNGGWWDVNLATDASKVLSFSASFGGLSEDLGEWSYQTTLGVTARPIDSLSLDLDFRYKRRHGWLVYQGDRNFGEYDAIEWQPGFNLNWFLAPNHQLRLSLQWAGVKAEEEGFWTIPADNGQLVPGIRTKANHDFTISQVTTQFRYRWEIAPLTDFYLVYNLGNALPRSQLDSGFQDLFTDAFDDPIVNRIIAKLRYRFGN